MATIPQIQRYSSNIPKGVKEIDTVDHIALVGADGQQKIISYADFISILNTLFLAPGDIKLYYAVSTTAITIASGVINFAIDDGLAYEVGQRVRVTYNEYNFMEGYIKSYGTGAMQIYCDYLVGSGSYSQWILSPSTEQRVPSGGSSGDVLTKGSGADYDAVWAAPSGGGGGSINSDYNNSFFLMGA